MEDHSFQDEGKLAEDLNKMLEHGSLNDVQIKLSDGEIFANKDILMARSDYFATMFKSNNFIEGETNLVDMSHCSKTVMEKIIKFFFTGEGKFGNLSLDQLSELCYMSEMMLLEKFQAEVKDYIKMVIANTKLKESSQNVCPFSGCQEEFSKTKIGRRKLLTHYLTTHQESTLAYHLVETLEPGKVPKSPEIKLKVNKVTEYFYLCTKSNCLATFRKPEALVDHRKLCLPGTAEKEKCKHCLGIFKFCAEHIANKECVHVGELIRIRNLTA